MKIAVCVKSVPDTETKIALNANKTNIDTNGVKFITSPYDEFALEEALKIKDANPDTTVTCISLGSNESKEVLRDCLARGASDSVHITVDDGLKLTPLATAKILAKVLGEEKYDLIFCGQQGVGTDNSMIPSMLGSLLNVTSVNMIISFSLIDGSKFSVKREIEGAQETIEGSLPAILSAQKGLNEPRYPSIKGVMAARKKEIKTLDLNTLGISDEINKINDLIKIKAMALPQGKTGGKTIDGDPDNQVKELVSLLRQEAKVL